VVAVLTPRPGDRLAVGPTGRRAQPDRRPLRLVTESSPDRYGGDCDRDNHDRQVSTGATLTTRPVRRVREAPEVYRRRRTVALGLLVAALIGLWLGVHSLLSAPGPTLGSARPAAVHVWTVRPGDTLWSIASSVQPKGDIRPLVDALSAEVHGQPLTVGQQLAVP
jgi:hypothetical protein